MRESSHANERPRLVLAAGLAASVLLHLAFVVVCCVGAAVARQVMGLPPALLSAVLIVALLLFSPDIFRFMVLRNKVLRLRAELSS